jgi:hypothetical protein
MWMCVKGNKQGFVFVEVIPMEQYLVGCLETYIKLGKIL